MIKDIHYHLTLACKQHKPQAQKQLFELYADAMLNVAYKIIQDRDCSQDVVQEAFIKVFRHIDSFNGQSTIGAWIKRIVVNQAINELKKQRFDPLPEGYDVPEPENQKIEWNVEAIKKAMALLPAKARTVFSLYAFEGYDHSEIAGILHITVEGSKSQYSRAKKKIRDHLNPSLCKKA